MKTISLRSALLLMVVLGINSCKKSPVEPTNRVDFTGSPVMGKAPLTVYFNNLSPEKFKGWHWDFGDNKRSGLERPTHVFETPGQYTVTLRGFNDMDTVRREIKDFIFVISPEQPHPSFSVQTTGLAKETVFKFTNSSTGDIISYKWNFDDGTSSTEESPTHKYSKAGKYTATLTVTGPTGLTGIGQIVLYVDEIITVSFNSLGPFYPDRVNGDCDFAGHGPRVQLLSRVEIPSYGGTYLDKLYLFIQFRAEETESDWSTADYKTEHYLLYDPDPGIFIKEWKSSFSTQKYWDYEDTDHSYDYNSSNDFVDFKIMGDTPGGDICNHTLNDTHFYLENLSFKILIGPPH